MLRMNSNRVPNSSASLRYFSNSSATTVVGVTADEDSRNPLTRSPAARARQPAGNTNRPGGARVLARAGGAAFTPTRGESFFFRLFLAGGDFFSGPAAGE